MPCLIDHGLLLNGSQLERINEMRLNGQTIDNDMILKMQYTISKLSLEANCLLHEIEKPIGKRDLDKAKECLSSIVQKIEGTHE